MARAVPLLEGRPEGLPSGDGGPGVWVSLAGEVRSQSGLPREKSRGWGQLREFLCSALR